MKTRMVNVAEDGNHSSIPELFCTPRIVEEYQEITIAAFNIPLSVTAFLGNVLIIVALQKPSSLHPPSKLLLGCLASTDLCVGLITQPLFVVFLMFRNNSKPCFYVVTMFRLTGVIFGGVSLMTLTLISVDRLLALLLGLRYKQVVTLKRVWILVVIIWLSFPAAVLAYSAYNYRHVIFMNVVARGIVNTVLLVCIVITFSCYLKIYLSLRRQHAQVQSHVSQGQPHGGTTPLNLARYKKTVFATLWIQITLLACYIPYFAANAALAIYGSPTSSVSLAVSATLSLIYLNSSLNPFLYCWKLREVRQAVKDTIRQLCCSSS